MSLIKCKRKPLGFDSSEVRFADNLRLKVHEKVSPAQYSPRDASCPCISTNRGGNHSQAPFMSTSARFAEDEFRLFYANHAQFYDIKSFVDIIKAKNRHRFLPLMPALHKSREPSYLPFCSQNINELLRTKPVKLNERTSRKKSLFSLLIDQINSQKN